MYDSEIEQVPIYTLRKGKGKKELTNHKIAQKWLSYLAIIHRSGSE